jgi:OOP family OmpA-OmpF porin
MNKASSILMSLCFLVSLGANANTYDNTQIDIKKWYTGASFGSSTYDIDSLEMTGVDGLTFDGRSEIIEINGSLDKKDTAFKVFGGYQFNQYFSVEAAYTNLGELFISQEILGHEGYLPTDAAFNNTLNSVEEISGVTLNGVAQYPITNSFTLLAKLGLFRWNSDISETSILNSYYAVSNVGSTKTDETLMTTDSSSDSGTDAFYGLGLSYKIADFDIRAEYEIYKSDGESINVASIGALYRF